MTGLMYSAAAYCAYETIDTWNCGLPCQKTSGLSSIKRFHNSDRNTFGYAGYNPSTNQIIVAFRGTNGADIQNWISNI